MRKKTRVVSRIGAVAALAMGLTVALGPAAFATDLPAEDAPTIIATPSTDLDDGAVVEVRATGFAPNETIYVGQCADLPSGEFVCSEEGLPSVSITTDGDGTGSVPFTVHATFTGYVVGGGVWGTVDCHTVACYIGAGNATHGAGSNPLAFK